MTTQIFGDLNSEDYNFIKKHLENNGLDVSRGSSKGVDIHHVITLLFSDFSFFELIRDVAIEKALSQTFKIIKKHINDKSDRDVFIEFDDKLNLMGKIFDLKIKCPIDNLDIIKQQINLKITPYVQGLIPDGSTLIINGNREDSTIQIIVIEKGSNKEYML